MFFSTSENENPELYKNGGRSAMKGGRSAMLQTFPLGGRSAMWQIFRGKVCNVADLPVKKVCKGEGLQYNTGSEETKIFKAISRLSEVL